MSNPQKAIDYAFRAVHLTAVTAKDVTRDYYGAPVRAPTGTRARTGADRG
jgi:hypothetical protein